MRSTHIQIITIALLLLVTACSSDGAQQTLVAENAMLSTQIVDLRVTAVFQADQLKQTQEYVETIIPKANRLRDELASTLVAAGIDVTLHPVNADPSFTLGTVATAPAPNSNGGQQSIIVEGTSMPAPAQPGSTIDAAIGAVTATAGQPTLFNLVTAEGVGSNDCALASVTSFSANAPQIYVVATAGNVAAGSTLGANWYLGDTLLTSQEFSPKDNINNNCIWFYAEPVDFPFTPGSYRVELLINGTVVTGAQASFTIQSGTGSGDSMPG
ncbi:MAG: hypothetical protein GC179_26535 [Anaerolineaceae bacterium]|nr:hypothetical protein [Anaerolineaceae bacterium]